MSVTPSPPPLQARLASLATFFRLSVDEYHDMIRTGILTTEDRVELLDGLLVHKMPQNNPHSSTVDRLNEDLGKLVPAGWRVRIQLPITLRTSEPEPDAAIVRGHRRTFDQRHPLGSDFGIVIEVADTSLSLDRREKGRLYAEAGIPEYWIINLVERQVEVFTLPNAALNPVGYAQQQIFTGGQAVPLTLDGTLVGSLLVDDLLP
jgi:Uma2 family endonuclease